MRDRLASPLAVLVAAAVVAAGSLTAASLALVDVLSDWVVVFFYAVPTLFFLAWGAREFAPATWRRAATPLRRAWRSSRLAPRPERAPVAPPPPRRRRESRRGGLGPADDVFAALARIWVRMMRVFLEAVRDARVRRAFNVVVGISVLALLGYAGWDFATTGWPLGSADAPAVAAAAALFLSTFALRAVAWQRVFLPFERPRSLALVGSTGSAALASVVFPSRVDDAIAIAVLRRLARRPPSVGTLVLSLFLLGLTNVAALVPFALYAALASPGAAALRGLMALVAGVGLGAAVLAAALPAIRRRDRLVRRRLGHWLALHAPASRLEMVWAWWLVAASWLARIAGVFLLLEALALPASFALAAAYVAAGAAAAALPIGPAGAATQAGAGAIVLVAVGADTSEAVALALVAQLLSVAAGGAFAALAAAAHLHGRRRRASAREAA